MELHKLKEKLVKEINESNLEIDCIYYVLKSLLSEVADLYNKQLEIEKEEENGKDNIRKSA